MTAGAASERLIGRRLLRQEDPRLLTGRGAYVTDLALPGMLHMALLRSPHAHARIAHVDIDRARRVPSVVGVFTADHIRDVGPLPVLAHPPGQRQTDFPVLPADRVRYVGQPLAAVVAETRYAAQDGVDALDVTYSPLPVVANVTQATFPGAPKLYDDWPDNVVVSREINSGDADAVLATATTVVEARFTMPRQTAAPMEGRATCARFDARHPRADRVGVESSAAPLPHGARRGAAPRRGAHPRDRPRRGRRIRREAPLLPGGRAGGGRRHAARSAGEVGGDAHGALRVHRARARAARACAGRVRRAGDAAGAPGARAGRRRRAPPHQGRRPDLPRRRRAAEPLRRPSFQGEDGRRRDQQGAVRRVPRLRHAAGGVRHRAIDGHGGRAPRDRPRRDPAPQLCAADGVPLSQRRQPRVRQRQLRLRARRGAAHRRLRRTPRDAAARASRGPARRHRRRELRRGHRHGAVEADGRDGQPARRLRERDRPPRAVGARHRRDRHHRARPGHTLGARAGRGRRAVGLVRSRRRRARRHRAHAVFVLRQRRQPRLGRRRRRGAPGHARPQAEARAGGGAPARGRRGGPRDRRRSVSRARRARTRPLLRDARTGVAPRTEPARRDGARARGAVHLQPGELDVSLRGAHRRGRGRARHRRRSVCSATGSRTTAARC